jgi:N-acetylglucosamine kinase
LAAEGSAYAIASAAIRDIFHALDGFDPNEPSFYSASAPLGDPRHPPQNTSAACSAMLRYFSLSEPAGMLDVMYGAGFKKDAVAGFAVEVSALGQAGDRFCAGVMARAGRELGAHLRAMVKRRAAGSAGGSAGAGAGGGAPAGGSAGAGAGGGAPAPPLSIVCVGSVWKSWELLKESFVRAACAGGAVTAFRLVRLTESSAVGAAWQAGVRAGHAGLALDTTAFVEVLYEHGPPPPRPAEVPQAHPEHGLTVFTDGSRKLEDR